MRILRRAIKDRNQKALDAWKQNHPDGIVDRYGVTHYPETSLRKLIAAKRHMTSTQRDLFSSREWYATTDRSDAKAA